MVLLRVALDSSFLVAVAGSNVMPKSLLGPEIFARGSGRQRHGTSAGGQELYKGENRAESLFANGSLCEG